MAEKRPYESPRIARLETAAAALTGKNPVLEVLPATAFEEPYDIRRLLTAYGSPLFLVSEKALRARYRSFRDTFTAPDIDTRIAYSYKTNYLPALCAILHEEGAGAEVVSGMEYQLARALGVPGELIVFNGPLKRREELETAVGEGALVNIDGFEGIAAIDAVARALGRAARVGVRVNFRYGNASWTKFGFSHDSGESLQALEQVAARPHLRLEALHNHSGDVPGGCQGLRPRHGRADRSCPPRAGPGLGAHHPRSWRRLPVEQQAQADVRRPRRQPAPWPPSDPLRRSHPAPSVPCQGSVRWAAGPAGGAGPGGGRLGGVAGLQGGGQEGDRRSRRRGGGGCRHQRAAHRLLVRPRRRRGPGRGE